MVEVLYEDNHLIAVNKKAGHLVQGDKTKDIPLLDFVKNYIKKKYNKPGKVFLGTIHRLDRPTSGIVLFAKTSKALVRMNKKFQNHEVKKTYWAIVDNCPPNEKGILENFLKKNHKQNKSYVSKEKNGKYSLLEYRLLKKLNNYFLLEILPKTGRHHQIRAQLSNIGCVIKGDLKYGSKRSNKDASIHLLAKKIVFKHPVNKKEIVINSNPPKDVIWNTCI